MTEIVGIREDCHAPDARQDIREQLEAFAAQFRC
jgi:hypothetical protein